MPSFSYNDTAANWTDWDPSACAATPPTQILFNPSFECSEMGWDLEDVEIVWGVPDEYTPPSKHRRDTESADPAYDGAGFARFSPSFEDVSASLSQTLETPALNGSYWYTFVYRVPPSGDTSDGCTLTVSSDEGVLDTIGSLSSAGAWTMTGKEFIIEDSVSTFSFEFSCAGADSVSPLLDVDDFKLGISTGPWNYSNGTEGGGYGNSTGPPIFGGAPPSNETSNSSGPPSGPPPLLNLTSPAYADDSSSAGYPPAADSSTAGDIYDSAPTTTVPYTPADSTPTIAAVDLEPTTSSSPSAPDPTVLADAEPADPTVADAMTTTTTTMAADADAEPPAPTNKVKRHRYHNQRRRHS